jgi:hypothetical protein
MLSAQYLTVWTLNLLCTQFSVGVEDEECGCWETSQHSDGCIFLQTEYHEA